MRVTIWLPRTPFGLLASILPGILIGAAVAEFWTGGTFGQSTPGSRGTRDAEAAFLGLAAALSGGSWVGTHLERFRLRPRGLEAEAVARYMSQLRTRQLGALAAIHDEPWAAEAIDRSRAAQAVELRLESVLDTMLPVFSLSFDSLIRHGLVSAARIAEIRARVRSGDVPPQWLNPMILRDLMRLDSREDALVRIGLFLTDQERTTAT